MDFNAPMSGGPGNRQNQHRNPNDQMQHHQGLLFSETDQADQEGGLPFLDNTMMSGALGFHPGDGNQLAMPQFESPGGYMPHQSVSSIMPYTNAGPSTFPVVTRSYPQHLVGPAPAFLDRIEATFEGYPLGSVALHVPDNCDSEELARRLQALQLNQEHHRQNPPVIPDHTLGCMEEKRVFPDYLKFPQNATHAEKVVIERINNRIAARQQKDDRARNNEAAKRSRLSKAEALLNSTSLNVDLAIRLTYTEAQLIMEGGDPSRFDELTPDQLAKIRGGIIERMQEIYATRKKEKSDEESRKRPQRNKRRQRMKAEVNERFARQRAEAARTGCDVPITEGVIESDDEGGMAKQRSLPSRAGPTPSFDFSQD